MGLPSRAESEANAARAAVINANATLLEKAEMLMEVAMGLQQKPKTPADLEEAISLYDEAEALCADTEGLLKARIRARRATAEMALPVSGPDGLEAARRSMDMALPDLQTSGKPEEVAEAEMNLGLILQNLAGMHRARIQDAIAAYQRALRTFTAATHPVEFAILQNNLATAFLSIPFTDERSKMREALAVQAFEDGLNSVTLIDHPGEYAMLQNNLGNALQYVSSSHRIENGFRALEAYDEALRVRTLEDAPSEYANTIANKANCLANLPDDPAAPDAGNPEHLKAAIALYGEAASVFDQTGEVHKAQTVRDAISELQAELCEEAAGALN